MSNITRNDVYQLWTQEYQVGVSEMPEHILFTPDNGHVEWFKDEFGTIWLKFTDHEMNGREQIIPQSAVLRVVLG